MPDELKSLRDRLDAVDRRIVEALAERQHVVGEVSRLKLASAPIRIRDVDREDALLTRIVGLAEQAGADPVLLARLYRDILAASVHWQQQQVVARDNPHRPKRVAYQGRPGSYSHAAATRHFAGTPVTLEGHDSFRSMLDAVADDRADIALLPVENTTAGSIHAAMDLLATVDLHLVGETLQPVDHCLIGLGPLEGVRRVYSHPQALLQCTRFLEERGLRAEAWTDTAGAVAHIGELNDPSVAAIASAEAAQLHGLPILARGIADQEGNTTRMVLVARDPVDVDHRIPCKTSVLFATRHVPGALLACLRVFDEHGLNLTKLESRPRPKTPWQYRFYVDFEGNISDPQVQEALQALPPLTAWIKVLGSYPSRTGAGQRAPVHRPPRRESARPTIDPVRLGAVTIGLEPVRIAAVSNAEEALTSWREGAHALLVSDHGLARSVDLPAITLDGEGDAMWISMDAPLEAVSRQDVPVFLVRAPGASVDDWLASADRIREGGNQQIVLVDAGVHGVGGRVLDLAGLAALASRTPCPVVVDTRDLGAPDALEDAARAVGAAGVVVGD